MNRVRSITTAALVGLCMSAPMPIQAATPAIDIGWDVSLWRVMGALIFCLLLAAAGAFALRSRVASIVPFAAKGRRLRLIESLRLSHQTDLCLIVVDGRELVIAATPRGATLLLDRGEPTN